MGDSFRALAIAPDVATVAVSARGDGVTVFDMKTARSVLKFPAGLRVPRAMACRPGGQGFALGQPDGTVALYSASGQRTGALGRTSADVVVVTLSPDGRTLAAGDVRGTVAAWDVPTGRRTAYFPASKDPVEGLAFTPDGTRLVATSNGYPCPLLLDLTSGRQRPVIPGVEGVYGAAAFSPDGRTLALAGARGDIILWDESAGRPRGTLRGHRGRVWALAFSPDGRRLASGGNDMTVCLWDVPGPAGR
jgi:hypothetical protein